MANTKNVLPSYKSMYNDHKDLACAIRCRHLAYNADRLVNKKTVPDKDRLKKLHYVLRTTIKDMDNFIYFAKMRFDKGKRDYAENKEVCPELQRKVLDLTIDLPYQKIAFWNPVNVKNIVTATRLYNLLRFPELAEEWKREKHVKAMRMRYESAQRNGSSNVMESDQAAIQHEDVEMTETPKNTADVTQNGLAKDAVVTSNLYDVESSFNPEGVKDVKDHSVPIVINVAQPTVVKHLPMVPRNRIVAARSSTSVGRIVYLQPVAVSPPKVQSERSTKIKEVQNVIVQVSTLQNPTYVVKNMAQPTVNKTLPMSTPVAVQASTPRSTPLIPVETPKQISLGGKVVRLTVTKPLQMIPRIKIVEGVRKVYCSSITKSPPVVHAENSKAIKGVRNIIEPVPATDRITPVTKNIARPIVVKSPLAFRNRTVDSLPLTPVAKNVIRPSALESPPTIPDEIIVVDLTDDECISSSPAQADPMVPSEITVVDLTDDDISPSPAQNDFMFLLGLCTPATHERISNAVAARSKIQAASPKWVKPRKSHIDLGAVLATRTRQSRKSFKNNDFEYQ